MTSITENIASVRERLAAACHRAGRNPEDVRLVAVSKTVPPEGIREAYAAGLRDFGENRVQEAQSKHGALSDLQITWHLIGHLQTNKAKPACGIFRWVHSVDSLRLAERLDSAANTPGKRLPVLLEINLGGEESKSGVREDAMIELARQVAALPHLELRGLMTIPPFLDDPEEVRPFFARLAALARRIDAERLPKISMRELSMGMSHDFEVAVEQGATMVRIGTAIFGSRH